MRQKRAKAYRKLMHTYAMSFGFRQPYQVLVDSEMSKDAITHKVDLVKQLHNVLQGEVKPMITQCCIHELYMQGVSQQPAVDLAKSFERRKCNHRDAISGDECLQSVIGDHNQHRYLVATQSHTLRSNLRKIPATPLVHLTRSVMVLEPMSEVTMSAKEVKEEGKLHATAPEVSLIESPAPIEPVKKRKGPKGPNPLSVKKKKAHITGPSITQSSAVKRKAETEEHSDHEADSDTAVNESSTKRRRKRRKKAVVGV